MKKLLFITMSAMLLSACSNDTEETTNEDETVETPEAVEESNASEDTVESAEDNDTEDAETSVADKETDSDVSGSIGNVDLADDSDENKEAVASESTNDEETVDDSSKDEFFFGVLDPNFINEVSSNPELTAIDVVVEDMTQKEVEDLYGATYDTIIPKEGSNIAVYGNVGVRYSGIMPAGEDTFADATLDPESNWVTDVYPVMNVSHEDIINTFGEPALDYDEFAPRGPGSPTTYYKSDYGEIVGLQMTTLEDGRVIADMLVINEIVNSIAIPIVAKEYMLAIESYYNTGDTSYQDMQTVETTTDYRVQDFKEQYPGMQTIHNDIDWHTSSSDDEVRVSMERTFIHDNISEPITNHETLYIQVEDEQYKIRAVAFE